MFSMIRPTLIIFYLTLMTSTTISVQATLAHKVQLYENEPKGTVIADLTSFIDDVSLKTSGRNFQLLSQKLSTPVLLEKKSNWFKLQKVTGKLILNKVIDREAICGSFRSCSIVVQVYATFSSRIITLEVEIVDVNDNPPVFRNQLLLLNVSENLVLGSVIDLDLYAASDKDIENNSAITYSLNPNPYFGINQFVDDTETSHLQLRVQQQLDHETKSFITLSLSASDNGHPNLSSHIPLQINILDENDNQPEFTEAEYSVHIHEDVSPGQIVARVEASDPDSGTGGTVSYVISGPNKDFVSSYFNLDSVSGQVVLKKSLDREEIDEFNIFIEARDHGIPSQVGHSRLVVFVDDVNDNAPDITVTFLVQTMENIAYLPEDTSVNSDLAYVSVKDRDDMKNGDVSISMTVASLTSDGEFLGISSAFRLTEDDLHVIRLNEPLDAEEQNQYKIILNATDAGKNIKWNTKEIFVKILDANDHSPEFSKEVFELYIMEDIPVGKEITQMRAVDLDQNNAYPFQLSENREIVPSTNGNVTYILKGGEGTFSIDPKTGVVKNVRLLDRERVEKWTISVEATDGGYPKPLKTSCQLIINIMDTNDNAPVFINSHKNEKSLTGTIANNRVITRVQAVDYDVGKNGQVRYNLLSVDGVRQDRHINNSLFIIDYITGDLRVNMSFPDLISSIGPHTVTVQARDQGYPPMKSSETMLVLLTNEEAAPIPNSLLKTSLSFSTLLLIIITASTIFLFSCVLLIIIFVVRQKQKKKEKESFEVESEAMESLTNDATLQSTVDKHQEESFYLKERSSLMQNRRTKHDFECIHHIQPEVSVLNEKKSLSSTNKCQNFKNLQAEDSSMLYFPQRGRKDLPTYHSDAKHETFKNSKYAYLETQPLCSEKCLDLGHGDSCWIPRSEEVPSVSLTQSSNPYPYVSLKRFSSGKKSPEDSKYVMQKPNKFYKQRLYSEEMSLYQDFPKPIHESSSIETVPSLPSQAQFPRDFSRSKLDFAPIGSSTDTGYMTEAELV